MRALMGGEGNVPGMGFDQYHEPPDELPAQTRTFARMCASLTEEAEAIGWYEQRIAIETDREARAVMQHAQGEEFKHFAMDLEYLLRRTPLWREIAAGRPVPGRRHRRARRGGRGRARVDGGGGRGAAVPDGSLGIGAEEGGVMNHLLREHAPITEAGWELTRRRGARAPDGRRSPRAGSSTSTARTAGSTRRPTSAASAHVEGARSTA